MPNASTAKTASARRKLWLLLGAVLAVAVLCLAGLVLLTKYNRNRIDTNDAFYCVQPPGEEHCSLSLEPAVGQDATARGLSGRDHLDNDKGMLFEFAYPAVQCFWMKDMKFSIDIVWIGERKEVLHKETNVNPNTYPKSFCPNVNALYVIEVNAYRSRDWPLGGQFNMYVPGQAVID